MQRIAAWKPLVLLAILCLVAPVAAEAAMTKDEALKDAFPEAEQIDKEILYFSEAERERVAEVARAPVDSRMFTVYKARAGGEVTGYAFIDTRTVRSKPVAFLVVLEPDGAVRASRVLAWNEPPEYRPPERWLAQFAGQGVERATRLGGKIQAMSGATLTSETLTDGIRRVLAIHRVKLAGED